MGYTCPPVRFRHPLYAPLLPIQDSLQNPLSSTFTVQAYSNVPREEIYPYPRGRFDALAARLFEILLVQVRVGNDALLRTCVVAECRAVDVSGVS